MRTAKASHTIVGVSPTWRPEAHAIERFGEWCTPKSSESLAFPGGSQGGFAAAEIIGLYHYHSALPQLRVRSAAPSEREPRALRASGSPGWRPLQSAAETGGVCHSTGHSLKIPRFSLHIVTGRVREVPYRYNLRSVIIRRHYRQYSRKPSKWKALHCLLRKKRYNSRKQKENEI